MSESFEKLLILQGTDRRIMQLTREQRDIPKRKQEIESSVNRHEQAVADAKENLLQSTLRLKELDGDVEMFNQRLRKYKEQQLAVKNNDEYRALDREIASTKRDIGKFEERQLVVMESMEELKQAIADKVKELEDRRKEVEAELSHMDERLVLINQEIGEQEEKRLPLIEGIDPQWLARYERILRHVGDYAMVDVINGTCAGCHMQLPPQQVHDSRKRDTLTSCAYCGRILYTN